ncbi:MAG: mismatch repair protein MutL [Oscillospiraceae bacterium]|nr:mismatch repair protein MutL [Oscillospiraceae bacterium]
MPKINTLDPHVADLIAAGEVVERPASVVKELLENAIDAGAGSATVEISRGGMSLIRVTDNGCGIPADELETAFLRHATSKIRNEYDLEAIGTLGFRGEALAAIGAVSRIDVLTRTEGAALGAALRLEGGTVTDREETGCPQGTTMVVRDLFFNTPARLKFMKRDASEGAAVFDVVQRVALSHPEVSIRFLRDGKQELLTPGDGQLKSAMYSVFGRDIALGFAPVKGSGEGITVSGFASLPVCCRGSRSYQHFYVNGRYVKSRTMTAALEEAYANQKMVGKFPGCVLHLNVKLNMVDVNVHPAKIEVKFINERMVFDALYHAVLSALTGEHFRPAVRVVVPSVLQPEPEVAYQTVMAVHDSVRPIFQPESGAVITHIPPSPDTRQRPVGSPAENPAYLREQDGSMPQKTPAPPIPEQKQQRVPDTTVMVTQAEPLPQSPQTQRASAPLAQEHRPEAVQELRDRLQEEPSPEVPDEPKQEPLPWRMAGELFATYIIVEQGDTAFLIDKHAAHERMWFDRLKSESHAPMGQMLLEPVTVKLSGEERAALLQHLPLLRNFGFEAEEFGGGALIIRQIPDYLKVGETESALTELAERLLTAGGAEPAAARDELLHTMACKAAIKGGQKNSPQELLRVAEAVMRGEVKYCPHGRPVAVELPRAQLEKQFKRT